MKTIILTYVGPVDADGKINLPKHARMEISQVFSGATVEVTIRKARRSRSSEQNRYYWGVVVDMIVRAMHDLGNTEIKPGQRDSAEIVHEFLKNKFLPPVIATDAHGQEIKLPPSTRKVTTTEMMDYIAEIQMWAAEYLGIVIPNPGEQMKMFQYDVSL